MIAGSSRQTDSILPHSCDAYEGQFVWLPLPSLAATCSTPPLGAQGNKSHCLFVKARVV